VSDYSVVRIMGRVALGLYGDSAELDQWFELGKRLAPGSSGPYSSRLYTLEPKWLGSVYETMTFARKMQDTGSMNLRLPLLMVTAHEALAEGLDEEDRNGYFAEPLVCSDVLGVYEKFLQQYPDSGWDRAAT